VDEPRNAAGSDALIGAPGESAESFTSLFNATSEGMVLTERGIMIAVNRTLAALLGRDPRDIVGRSPLDFTPESFHALVAANMAAGYDQPYEAAIKRADGMVVSVEINGRPIRYQGRTVRLVMVRDITERRRIEDALRASERRFRALVQHSSDVTIIRDLAGAIRYISPAAAEVFGYTPEELLGHNRVELVHPDDYKAMAAHIAAIHARPGVYEPIVYRVRHRDGTWRWLEGTATNLLDEPAIQGIVVNARDVTARKQAEEERDALLRREQTARAAAEQTAQLREEFLTIASHELKTPLTTIKGSAELLVRYLQRAETAQDTARLNRLTTMLHQQIEHMTVLVDDLLDLSRLQRGQLLLRPGPLDFAAVVRQVVERFRIANERDAAARLVLAAPAALPGVADESRLDQIITNLVSNALKYSPEGGEVSVALRAADTQVELAVSDRGMGIELEDKALLFQPYARGPQAGAVASGIGVGLYITARIVERHGGSIAVMSVPGAGSTFTVRLPLAGPPGVVESSE
jgi:PAS domain S-box-containing protein